MSSYNSGKGNHSTILNNFFLIFIQLGEEVVIYFLKPSYKKYDDFPSLVIWG